MFRKHTIALGLLAVATTSGAAFAAQGGNDTAESARPHRHHVAMLEHRNHVVTPGANSAEIGRFFNGNPPEGWPYTSD